MTWQVVLECPKCGQQSAAGDSGPDATPIKMQQWCSMGHERTEMEQKLPEAWDYAIQPEDVR